MTNSNTMPQGWLICCLALLFAAPFFSHAQTFSTPPLTSLDDIQQGSLLLRHPDWDGMRLSPQLDTQVDMQITGLVARVTVKQRFYNPDNQWVNATYLFPLPEQSAVDGLTMRIGDRLIEGEIQAKQQARETFEQAKAQGKKASLVEQHRPNLFTNEIANIGPGERIEVEIRYQQTVLYDNGQFHVRFPMTVTPRYSPLLPTWQQEEGVEAKPRNLLEEVAALSHLHDPHGRPANQISLRATLLPGFKLAGLSSPYHDVTVNRAEQQYEVQLKQTDIANRDFQLRWRAAQSAVPQISVIQQGDYGVLMVVPASQPDQRQVQARELILLLDTSGSMYGDAIEQAKAAVRQALGSLTDADTFNLIEFNSDFRAVWPAAQVATTQNIQLAQRFVDALQADGGTEMASALTFALQDSDPADRLRQIVFITDGAVGNEEQLMQIIQRRLGVSRLFTVGIGSAPNSYFMSEAAEMGRGAYTLIGDIREVSSQMTALLNKLRYVALTDLAINFSGDTEFFPRVLPDVYIDQPLSVTFRSNARQRDLVLSGMFDGMPFEQPLVMQQSAAQGLEKLWARSKITQLERERRQAQEPEAFNQAITDVALEFELVSEFTSLVAVDKTPTKPERELALLRGVPNALPLGMLPIGASGWKLNLLLALFAGLCALWINRRL